MEPWVSDPFAITEQPVPVPEAVRTVDLAAEMARLMVRCARFEDALKREGLRAAAAERDLLLGLLEVADALDRVAQQDAPERLRRALEATQRLVRRALSRAGVVPMNLAGMAPDPAIADIEAAEPHPDLPDETVVRQVTTGYWWREEVLRRARVIVADRG
jgi:molecular chaperone GrpE (heat shock protein)